MQDNRHEAAVFLDKPDGFTRVLNSRNQSTSQSWREGYTQRQQDQIGAMFKEALNAKMNDPNWVAGPVSESELAGIADSVLSKVENRNGVLDMDFQNLANLFTSSTSGNSVEQHGEILQALDQCAAHANLCAAFDDVPLTGPDDISKYYVSKFGDSVRNMRPQERENLFNAISNHPASKEICCYLLNGEATSALGQHLDNTPSDPITVKDTLVKFHRTADALDGILTALDIGTSPLDEGGSEMSLSMSSTPDTAPVAKQPLRTEAWIKTHADGFAGGMKVRDENFMSAFKNFQLTNHQLDLDKVGLKTESGGARLYRQQLDSDSFKQEMVHVADSDINAPGKELGWNKAFLKDLTRSEYRVNGEPVTGTQEERLATIEQKLGTKNAMIMSHFAHQGTFASVMTQSVAEFGTAFTYQEQSDKFYDMSVNNNGDLQLHCGANADISHVSNSEGDIETIPEDSPYSTDVVLKIEVNKESGKVSPSLPSPVSVDYQIHSKVAEPVSVQSPATPGPAAADKLASPMQNMAAGAMYQGMAAAARSGIDTTNRNLADNILGEQHTTEQVNDILTSGDGGLRRGITAMQAIKQLDPAGLPPESLNGPPDKWRRQTQAVREMVDQIGNTHFNSRVQGSFTQYGTDRNNPYGLVQHNPELDQPVREWLAEGVNLLDQLLSVQERALNNEPPMPVEDLQDLIDTVTTFSYSHLRR
ncbi:MAG: hypothetical protein ACR2P9_00390 [Gammaproteobacteria bacterium]